MAGYAGIDAQLGFKTETTAGTTVTPDLFIPFTSESLDRSQPALESDGIRTGRLVRDDEESNGGLISVTGSTSGDLPVKGVTSLFKSMIGAVNTTGSDPYAHAFTPSDTLVSKTLQVGVPDGSGTVHPKTVAGAKCASWEIAGAEGAFVTWNCDWIAQRLTVGSRSLTDVATTDTSTTISSVTGFTEADLGKDVSGSGIPSGAYITAVPSSTTATISAAATATATGVTVVVGKALASASYPSSLSYYKMHHATLTIGGTAVPLKGFTLAGDNKLEARYLGGSRWSSEPTGTGELRDYTGTVNLEYASNTQLDRYFAGDNFALVITLTSGTSSVVFSLNARYDEGMVPMVGGRGRLMQDAPFHVLGSSDSTAFTSTVTNADSSAA